MEGESGGGGRRRCAAPLGVAGRSSIGVDGAVTNSRSASSSSHVGSAVTCRERATDVIPHQVSPVVVGSGDIETRGRAAQHSTASISIPFVTSSSLLVSSPSSFSASTVFTSWATLLGR